MTKFALLLLCFLTACSTLKATVEERLVGHWRYTGDSQSCDCVFKNDGTFSARISSGGRTLGDLRGRWSVAGDVLIYNYAADPDDRGRAGNIDKDKLQVVTANYYVIRAADGSVRRYRRVK